MIKPAAAANLIAAVVFSGTPTSPLLPAEPCRLDDAQDAGLDRLGQVRPYRHDRRQIGVVGLVGPLSTDVSQASQFEVELIRRSYNRGQWDWLASRSSVRLRAASSTLRGSAVSSGADSV